MVPTEFRIDDIRRAFSKASLVFANDGISAIYTYKKRWFTQTVDVGAVFERLLGACNRFSIVIKPGKSVRFFFGVELPTEITVFYPPLEEEFPLSLDDLMNEVIQLDANEQVWEFFHGTDLSDDNAVLQKIGELMSKKSDIVDIPAVLRMREMRRLAQAVLSCGFICEIEESDPEDDCGFLSFVIDDRAHIPAAIDGKLKQVLQELISASEEFGFEGSVQDGILTLTFSA